jgi:hypothetical protein
MRALIYKDLLALLKYCRFHLALCGIFLVATAFVGNMEFMRTYVLVFTGMMPATLIAYEETEHWDRTVLTMPLSRRMIVTEKYVVGMLLQLTALVLIGFSWVVQMMRAGQFDVNALMSELLMNLVLAIIMPSLMLPVVFKLGAERGRMALTLVLCAAMAVIVGGTAALGSIGAFVNVDAVVMPLAVAVVVLMYPISWLVAVHWYEKREF